LGVRSAPSGSLRSRVYLNRRRRNFCRRRGPAALRSNVIAQPDQQRTRHKRYENQIVYKNQRVERITQGIAAFDVDPEEVNDDQEGSSGQQSMAHGFDELVHRDFRRVAGPHAPTLLNCPQSNGGLKCGDSELHLACGKIATNEMAETGRAP